MKVLVVGSGGREHALCWAIADSPRCDALYCAPGNAGIAAVAQCVDIAANNLDGLIAFNQENNVDYVSNTEPSTYPDGLDTEVFSFIALETAYNKAEESFEREHVTPFIRTNGQFKRANYSNEIDLSGERWTVDEPEDFEVIENIINHF